MNRFLKFPILNKFYGNKNIQLNLSIYIYFKFEVIKYIKGDGKSDRLIKVFN